jgi:subtilisin family serine protease
VAGTVAQSTNNAIGVTGVAFNAQLLPVKVLDSSGNGSYENIIQGITYAVNQGAKVINMSLAGRSGSRALLEAVQNASEKGVLVVAAAGNSGSSIEFPAAYDDFVLAVGATRFDNTRTRYSNFGPQLDLVAPGGDNTVDQNNDKFADGILQMSFKTPGNYTYLFFEGTSMASPHVAGLAALLLSRMPNASPADIEDIMARSALNLGPPDEYGAGLIQAAAAMALVGPTTPQPPTPTFTPVSPTPVPVTPVPITPTDRPTPVTVAPTPTDTPTPSVPVTSTDTPTPGVPADTPTPTPKPPQPVTPLPEGELLLNGDFETDEAWVFGDTPIRGQFDTSVVFSGNRSVKLGIIDGPDAHSYTSVWQHVTIPAEASQASLTVHIYPVTQDKPGSDWQNVLILNDRFRTIRSLSHELSNSQTWEQRTYDLSDLRGKPIYVYFSVFNRGYTDKPSGMYVDKVSLTWAR